MYRYPICKILNLLFLIALAALPCNRAGAQEGQVENKDGFAVAVRLVPQTADRTASTDLLTSRYHIFRAGTEAGKAARLNGPVLRTKAEFERAPAQAALPPRFYPADMSYMGGALVKSAVFNNVYVDCPDESCWGEPEGFQVNLSKSNFIHVLDQYVGSKSNRRYSPGRVFLASSADFCTSVSFCSASDILGIVHAVASDTTDGGGSGYGHITNVFLPPGTDTCMDSGNATCYSPDNPATDIFCAYHARNVFSDIGETLFTVEPFQDVPGCAVEPGSPNGQEADSTDSTLLHETFEIITDPDQVSWGAINSRDDDLMEIADVCVQPYDSSEFIPAPIFSVGNSLYEVQLVYSNRFHDCTSSPSR